MVLNLLQVHSYTACPNDQTAYLAELKSGKEVLVVNAEGQPRSAIVGRVKIETRPLVGAVTLQQQNLWDLVVQKAFGLLCIPVIRVTRWLTLRLNKLCFSLFRDVA
jgi:3-dehydroquinate synthase class II